MGSTTKKSICPACKKSFVGGGNRRFCKRRICQLNRNTESQQVYRSTTLKPESNLILREQLKEIPDLHKLPALAKLRNLNGEKFTRAVNRMLKT